MQKNLKSRVKLYININVEQGNSTQLCMLIAEAKAEIEFVNTTFPHQRWLHSRSGRSGTRRTQGEAVRSTTSSVTEMQLPPLLNG